MPTSLAVLAALPAETIASRRAGRPVEIMIPASPLATRLLPTSWQPAPWPWQEVLGGARGSSSALCARQYLHHMIDGGKDGAVRCERTYVQKAQNGALASVLMHC